MNGKSSNSRKLKSAIYSSLPFVLMLAVLAIGVLFFVGGTRSKMAKMEEQKASELEHAVLERTNVEVVNLKPGKIVDSIVLPGIVEPWENVVIKAEVTGRITEILKDEGDAVKKGEVIARIDNRDYISAVKEAKANVDRRDSDLERNESLFKKKVISQSTYDSILAPAQEAEAILEKAKLQLERTDIKASFDGVINKRYIQLGALVAPGTAIADILDTDKVRVNIFIPEDDILKVQDLEEADITLTQNRDKVIKGKKVFLSEKPADGAQAYKLQMVVDNSEKMLRAGMFVESKIIRGVINNALLLPIYAVIPFGDQKLCYVEEDGVARMRKIVTGIISGDQVEIVSGLTTSDNVIIKGQRQLEDGELVKVVKSYN